MSKKVNQESEQELILLVDDHDDGLYAGVKVLQHAGFRVITAKDGEDALNKSRSERPDIILLDVMMPKIDGLEVTKRLKRDSELKYIPVILLSARDRLDDIVAGLDAGADGYITKPFKPDELIARTRAALRTKGIYQELKDLNERHERFVGEVAREFNLSNIIGESKAIKELFSLIMKVAPTDSPVLISGASGTGKELVAKAIHFNSSRSGSPFVAKNCAAFSEQLLESQLFGHIKGAFTGAIKDQKGLFEAADGGTLFLDELGEMPLHLQAKLLRALQEGMIMPVGTTEERSVNVRVLAATNKDLGEMVNSGTFREDLYYRINVIHINIPPLRERREDIPLLIHNFLEKAYERRGISKKSISDSVMDCFMKYDWRGNIRELQNEIERLLILSGDDQEINLEMISPHIVKASRNEQIECGFKNEGSCSEAHSFSDSLGERDFSPYSVVINKGSDSQGLMKEAIQALERQLISDTLSRHNGNKSSASKELGISRSSLISKVSEYGIE
ncbi:MAG TPA: sigma-54 dependent transcriptional regulator [Oligoflexia bacterium]|nr:sigma-54 dependent transcriptional regulator [Oligoflexia bacterium]HMP47275.1 sigma-54 dependent transcriptional regulator [Oligoflexia bacterium]